MLTFLLLASAQISPTDVTLVPEGDQGDEILVTASLIPVRTSEAPGSTTIFDDSAIEALGMSGAVDFLRLAPGISVATSGARGTETVVRIRGAESNHTLIFVDGIAFNDIAAANAARFDALPAAGLSRIELIRGPQSALWGSEALGGIVALSSPDPLGELRVNSQIEAGSGDFRRAELEFSSGGDRAGLAATANWLRSDGIDVLGRGTGDKDGFETLTFGLKGLVRAGHFEAGAVARYIHHDVEFDGFDPFDFTRADTLDESVAETQAGRLWAGFDDGSWSARVEGQRLDSRNRNRVGPVATAETEGRRTRYGGRFARRLKLGKARHDLVLAIEREEEDFSSRDIIGRGLERRLDRSRTAFVGEWRARWNDRLVTDVAVRHDDFTRFTDDTTIRLNAVLGVTDSLQLLAGYGEGIAQPNFTDLFGFPGFPFTGNPDLRPERSRGFEAGLRWRRPTLMLEAVSFSNNLQDEIVEDFGTFPATVINSAGNSRRRGVEFSADWRPTSSLRLNANYTLLDAHEKDPAGVARPEIRRPRHSANIYGEWRSGPLTTAGSVAYVGRRTDRDFDLFPSPIVRLEDYWLSSMRIAYRLLPSIEAFARIENGFDSDHEDLFGYNSPGRTVNAGLRVALAR